MNAPRKRGRPSLDPGRKAERINVSLDQATIDKALLLADGNLSAGIRLAVAKCKIPTTSPADSLKP